MKQEWQLKMQSLHPTTCQRANHHLHLQQHEQASSRGGLDVSSIWCMRRRRALHWFDQQCCHTTMSKGNNPGKQQQWAQQSAKPICPWDIILMAQTLCIFWIWMYEVIRGGFSLNNYTIASFSLHKWPILPQIWRQLGLWNSVVALETAYHGSNTL